MMLKVSHIAASTWLLLFSVSAFAGETEDAVIEKTVRVYGGEALLALKTLRINDAYKSFRRGQSRSATEVDQVSYRTSTTIDFEKHRKSMQSIGGIYVPDLYIQHTFYDGERGYQIHHHAQTAAERSRMTFARADKGLSWKTDIALVKLLSENRASTTYVGEAVHKGSPQVVLNLQVEGYPVFTLHIDRDTGLVSKMTRPDSTPGSTYSYVFSDHRKQGDFTYAADTYVMRGGKPESLTATRSLDFNIDIDDAYKVPAGYDAPAKMISFPEMTVKQLSENVYHAGQNGAFSVFIDAGEYFIASGGYSGLKDRFEAVKAHTGSEKPLKYQIVTHHHEDHIGGLKDAAALGATFITVSEHVNAVRSATETPLTDNRFMIAGKNNLYADGRVRVVDIASWHANHNLVTYIPEAKIAFSADHFFTFLETGAPAPAEMYAQFKAALDEFDLDITRFAAAHSGRILTYDDLVQSSTAPIKELACPQGWDFCKG